MLSDNKISPNYQAIQIKDLSAGSLCFIRRQNQDKYLPHLLVKGESSNHLVSLSGKFISAPIKPEIGNRIAFVLSDTWRFRLLDTTPRQVGNPTSDINNVGKIAICEGLRVLIVRIDEDDVYLVDIDSLSPASDVGLYNHTGMISDWVIQTRPGLTETWVELFSNKDSKY